MSSGARRLRRARGTSCRSTSPACGLRSDHPVPQPCIQGDDGRYTLVVAPEDVDARDVSERAREARSRMASDPTTARGALVALERRWRGTAYEGLAEGSPLLEAEVARLEALRREIVVDRVGADLQLGRHARGGRRAGAGDVRVPLRRGPLASPHAGAVPLRPSGRGPAGLP